MSEYGIKTLTDKWLKFNNPISGSDSQELSIEVKPQVDMNGYDKVILGGFGKNKYPVLVTEDQNNIRASMVNAIDRTTIVANVFSGELDIEFTSNSYLYKASSEFGNSPRTISFNLSVQYASGDTTFTAISGGIQKVLSTIPASDTSVHRVYVTTDNPVFKITVSSNIMYGGYKINDVQIEAGSEMTPYEPYENIGTVKQLQGIYVASSGKNLATSIYTSSGTSKSTYFNFLKRGTYTVSIERDTAPNYIYINDANRTSSSEHRASFANAKTGTFSIEEDGFYQIEFTRSGSNPSWEDDPIQSYQLEEGTLATQHEANAVSHSVLFHSGIYGGFVNLLTGNLSDKYAMLSLNVSDMNNSEDYPGWSGCGVRAIIGADSTAYVTDGISNCIQYWNYNTNGNNDIIFLPKSRYNNMTQTEWKEKYPNLTITFVIPRLNPVSGYTIIPPNIHLKDGLNNIWFNGIQVVSEGTKQLNNGELTIKYMDKIPSVKQYIIHGSTLTGIANAIRTKKATVGAINAEDFADEIRTIYTNYPDAEEVEF